ncbi:MAG: CAP domain-containing protein, partial [Solirubrobacterales bacterium]
LGPLRQSRALARAARLHADNMARFGFFDHTDPQGRGVGERVAIFDRAHRFVGLGENIAAGYRSAALTCREWMNSSGHRGNILSPTYTHLGVGFAGGGPYGRYYVQVFGATTSASSSHLK